MAVLPAYYIHIGFHPGSYLVYIELSILKRRNFKGSLNQPKRFAITKGD
jgi:hypothetical protein